MYTFALLKTTKMNYRKEHIIYTLLWIDRKSTRLNSSHP